MIIVLLGPPGTGKGTQAAAVAGRFGLTHISTGDIFRRNLAEKTPLGLEAEGYMKKGELVPDDLVLRLVEGRLKEPDAIKGALLDGFPRTVGQAESFGVTLKAEGRRIDHVLLLTAEDSVLVNRLSGRRVCRSCGRSWHADFSPPPAGNICPCGGEIYQRADDQEEAILNRLAVYEKETRPLIDYYGQKGLIRRVDGDGTPAQVEKRIEQALTTAP